MSKTLNVEARTINIPEGWEVVFEGNVKDGDKLYSSVTNNFNEVRKNESEALLMSVESFKCVIRKIKTHVDAKELRCRELATFIHERTCTSNHTDQCGWGYESWDDPSMNWTRMEYYKKAEAMLNEIPLEVCKKVITLLR